MRDANSGATVATFVGHKGAVWYSRLNNRADRVITASADYTVYAYVLTWIYKSVLTRVIPKFSENCGM